MATARVPSPAPVKPGCLSGLDAAVSLHLHALFLPVPRLSLKALEVAGDGRVIVPVPISLLLLSAIPASSSWEASPLLVGLASGLVKLLVRRPRPSYNAADMSVRVAADHWSFPSDHSSRAFLVAAFLAGTGARGAPPPPPRALPLGGGHIRLEGAPWTALRARHRGWGLPRCLRGLARLHDPGIPVLS